jgi:Tol biopolymer transport system component
VNLGPVVNSTRLDGGPCLSKDGLSLYFFSMRPGGVGEEDLYVSKRAALDLPWQKPTNLGKGVNSSSSDAFPFISMDGLALYFGSNRSGSGDIYVSTRAGLNEPFGPAENLGPPINTEYSQEGTPWVSHDGLTIVFFSRRHASWNIYVSYRKAINEPWREPIDLGLPVSTKSGGESGVSFTADGKCFFFHGNHVNGFGYPDIWEARVLRTPEGFPGNINSNQAGEASAGNNGKEVTRK